MSVPTWSRYFATRKSYAVSMTIFSPVFFMVVTVLVVTTRGFFGISGLFFIAELLGYAVLKTVEGMGTGFTRLLKRALTANPLRQLGAALAKGAFRSIKHKMDPEEHGGAPLLGLNGNVIKVHGSARQQQVKNAITQTCTALQHKITEQIQSAVAQANQRAARVIEPAAASASA